MNGLVGVCKHMCGMATDLSIAALSQANKTFTIAGTVMATCCHHLCNTRSFGNLGMFEKLGLSKQ
jgi:tRNA:m4X modification enzyme